MGIEDLLGQMMEDIQSGKPTVTPLIQAVFDNNFEEFKSLLQKGNVDIDATDIVGYTALMYAAQEGNIRMVKMLLKYNADIHFKGRSGITAYDIALDKGNKDIADIIGPKKSANKKCDLCYKNISSSEMSVIPITKMQKAVKSGWRPSNEDAIGHQAKSLGLSDQELEDAFFKQVMSDSSDWGLCLSCKKDFENAGKQKSKAKIIQGIGKTYDLACKDAQNKLPKNSGSIKFKNHKMIKPGMNSVLIEASNETNAKDKAIRIIHKTASIESIKLESTGKKGFLGIGRKLNSYKVAFFQPFVVDASVDIIG